MGSKEEEEAPAVGEQGGADVEADPPPVQTWGLVKRPGPAPAKVTKRQRIQAKARQRSKVRVVEEEEEDESSDSRDNAETIARRIIVKAKKKRHEPGWRKTCQRNICDPACDGGCCLIAFCFKIAVIIIGVVAIVLVVLIYRGYLIHPAAYPR